MRTRAAATLAAHDFAAVLHGLLLRWAGAGDYRLCTQAANALALTAYAGNSGVHRVLRDWSADGNGRRRWTALRAHALIGPLAPASTLDSLEELARRAAARNEPDGEFGGLVEAAELLLLSVPGTSVARRLTAWCDAQPPVLRALAHHTLLTAAARREDPADAPTSWPLPLRQYGAADAADDREATAALWRRVLRERAITVEAQRRLRNWALFADRDAEVETALGGLLRQVIAVGDAEGLSDRDRLAHLLRTMPGADDGPPPPVADRLLAAIGAPERPHDLTI